MKTPHTRNGNTDSEDALQARYAESLSLHREGKLDEAEVGYRAILAELPTNFYALHMLGVLAGQRRDWKEAERLIAAAVDAGPYSAAAHANLGNARRLLNKSDLAYASYGKALELDPQNARAMKGLGLMLWQSDRPAEAMFVYDKLLAIEPGYTDGVAIRALCLEELARDAKSVEDLSSELEWGDTTEAEKYRYLLASRGLGDVPAAAPEAYVRELFNRYARMFDDHLVGQLQYRAPEMLMVVLEPHLGEGLRDVADLGCGTGLCGALLRPHARRLAGVDLSDGMLEQARLKQIYDELFEADLGSWLADQHGEFDLAIAADVLNYFGDLQPIFAACHDALRPGGLFAFTTERGDGEEPRLMSTLRYAHPDVYLQGLIAKGGWRIESQATKVIRQEKAKDVEGHVTVLRRAG